MPTFSLGVLASRLLHRFFSEKESDRLAGQHSPSPIRHLTAGATSATWANLVPGGWKRKVRTCTCGGGGRLLVVFFFFSPCPRGSGFSNHLANDQQVGRCLFPRERQRAGMVKAPE